MRKKKRIKKKRSFSEFARSEIDGGSFLKIDPENSFVEVVHLGLVTVNNFGKCK